MTDTSAQNAAVASRLDAVVTNSRFMAALRTAIGAPARAFGDAHARRLLAPFLDLDALSQSRAVGWVMIIAVITHTIALAVLRVPVQVLGWSTRGGLIAAGLLLARRPLAVAAAWKDKPDG